MLTSLYIVVVCGVWYPENLQSDCSVPACLGYL